MKIKSLYSLLSRTLGSLNPRTLRGRWLINRRRMIVGGLLSVVGGLLIFASCGGISDLKKYLGMIGQFQIISIITEPPETLPGQTVTLRAAAVNPETWGTANDQIVYYWVFLNLDTNAEMPGGVTFNINKFSISDFQNLFLQCPQTPACDFNSTKCCMQVGEGNSWDVTVPDRVPETGTALYYNIYLVAADSAATLSALTQGQETAGKYAFGVKSIKVSEATQYNHNPVIQEIFCDPATLDVSNGRFRASPGETYTLHAQVADVDMGDLIVYRWLILGFPPAHAPTGQLDSSNQAEVQWKAPDGPGIYPIFLVVRDEGMITGATDFLGGQAEREIQVEVGN